MANYSLFIIKKGHYSLIIIPHPDPHILQRPGSVIVFIIFCFKKANEYDKEILLDFSLTVKAATLIFIFGRGSAISSAKEGN